MIQFLAHVAEGDPFSASWSVLLNYGVAGVMIALMVFGRLHTHSEMESLKQQIRDLAADNQRKDDLIDRLIEGVNGQALPAMRATARAMEQIPSVEQDLYEELRQTQLDVKRLVHALNRVEEGGP